jgi:predicted ABC-class ATPase
MRMVRMPSATSRLAVVSIGGIWWSYPPVGIVMSSYSTGRGGRRGGGGGRGRGEYYRNKYGGGGGGGRHQEQQEQQTQDDPPERRGGGSGGGDYAALSRLLTSLNGRQYPCYRDLETFESAAWTAPHFQLQIGRVQADPYAPPTRCRITVKTGGFKEPNKIRAVAVADYLWRRLYDKCVAMGADQTVRGGGGGGGGWSGPKGGDIQVMKPTQHVLEQSAVTVLPDGSVQAQLTISLPARGRTILGSAASEILGPVLTELVHTCLLPSSVSPADLKRHVDSVEDQVWLQNQLDAARLVAFIRNGAILPRLSGVDDRPMDSSKAVAFQSPEAFVRSFTLPNAGVTITGMAIGKGVCLICGGGFHGKSTLLEALQYAVYPKLPGDGREFCVTSPGAVKIRSEDGRSINSVDISSFINNLPFGKDTTSFTSDDASGSTSQASNIIEVCTTTSNVL